jgi:hypothetical protein
MTQARILLLLKSAILAAAVASSAAAADRPLFVLRTAGDFQQGIVRFDPATGEESRFADFLFRLGFGPYGAFSMTSVADRVIAQGVNYYEFDATSGQLLRRYPALAAPYDTNWAFHGAAVDTAMADRLGIEPGFYGVPVCPPGPESPSACGGSVPFPGYEGWRGHTEQHVLLRRGLEPGDGSVDIVKLFSPDAAGGMWNSMRMTAVDPERQRFLFWLQGTIEGTSTGLLRLSAAPIIDGAVRDEVFIREELGPASNLDRRRSTEAFTFDAATDSVVLADYWGAEFQQRLTRLFLHGGEEVLKPVAADTRVHAVTALSPITPEVYTQIVAGVGDVPGANGTHWRSDAWLFNPSDAPVEITLRRVSSTGPGLQLVLAARASTRIDNVLRFLGGGPTGDGSATDAVIVESSYRAGAQLSVYSRTWTPSSSGGSYGQAVPALPSLVGYSNHGLDAFDVSDTPSMFLLDKRDPQQFRHNIGVVNPFDTPITIRLRYGSVTPNNPDPDTHRELVVPARSMRQYGVESLFPRHVVETRPPAIWVSGDRPAALWMSMVDNRTGDASFIPYTHYGIEVAPSSRLAFPAVAHTAGANDTSWRTDVYGVFANKALGGPVQSPNATFYPAAGACTPLEPVQFRLSPSPGAPHIAGWGPFWFHTFADVARQACPNGTGIIGALDIQTGSWMSAISRTYTTREDGGTYGETLPLYPPNGWPARHFPGIEVGSASRVNIGLFNGLETPSRLDLRLYHTSGATAATAVITLSSRESLQRPLEQIFGDLAQGLYALSIVPLDGGGTWPYVSIVDNHTGDPTNWW